ncbi:hypothetical protein QA612_16635 [Evansella sp. AB-P1]|uniref:hypothetical protein n=1 Tax=Evansella sp. AB-P1 TaxID=3037653 RepID=UPI00241C322E|nr:hypothetical protein [Evansella sp. AB-P1]MDG5789085.1 hypothetical protein [Evansella sp. AB-P1]
MEGFKSSYTEWYFISIMLLGMGGTISYALFLHGNHLGAFFLFIFLLSDCVYRWYNVYRNNKDIDKKAHLFVTSPYLTTDQKKYFVIRLREDLHYPKKRIFYIHENAKKVFLHYENKIQNNVPLNRLEQYMLNLLLMVELDLSMMYFRFQTFFSYQVTESEIELN